MKSKFSSIITLLVLIFGLHPTQAASAQSAPFAVEPGFGYTWQDISYQWVEIMGTGTEVVFEAQTTPEDRYTLTPIPIGFTFPYFEENYTEFHVSSNALISFNALSDSYPTNQRIPMDNPPNNIIAPLWADLILEEDNDSAVYYQYFNDANGEYLVIEFYNAYSLSHTYPEETLTFEVILYSNGNIDFIYQYLNDVDMDTLTIGFEDAGGVDGYQWLYNESSLPNDNQSIRAIYPADGMRVKAYPRILSGFAERGHAVLPFTVHNTGTQATAYSLAYDCPEGDAGWIVTFEDENANPITAIETLNPGQSTLVQVRMTSPENAQTGSYTRCTLTITSPDGGGTFEVKAQAAVAMPFAQTFVEKGDVFVQFVTSSRSLTREIFKTFTGAYLSLLHTGGMDYIMAGEKSFAYPKIFKNINMYRFLATGSAPITPVPLQDHAEELYTIKDSLPVMARTPDGQIGVAFLRQEKTSTPGQDFYNVYFGRLNSRGVLIEDPINLTNKPAGADERYSNISMTVDPVNDHFVLAWEKSFPQPVEGDFSDIEIAIIASDGNVVLSPNAITDSQNELKQYSLPSVFFLSTEKLTVSYKIQLASDHIRLGYAFFGLNGSMIGDQQELNSEYDSLDTGSMTAAPLSGGKWLMTWVNDRDEDLHYVLLDDEGILLSPAVTLVPFGLRAPGDIAATTVDGNVIMTWDDIKNNYLYYTVIDSAGEVLTPPMSFRRAQDTTGPNISITGTGTGLTTCPDVLTWYIDLPLIRR